MRIYPFFIPHYGCPHRCVFCQQQRTTEQEKAPTPAEVSLILNEILPSNGDGEAAFYGGTFTLLERGLQCEYLECAAPYIRSGRLKGIRVSTRPDALGPEAVSLLHDSGVTTVEIGCQSFSPQVLRLAERGHGAQDVVEAVSLLREVGISVGLQLMPGLPGGDRAEAIYSLSKALELKPDFLRIYPTLVLKGTALESSYHSGTYKPLSLDEAIDLCSELLWLCHKANVPVIRMGLQATPSLDSGEALVAGPYHPAFGQLVRSHLWLRALERGFSRTGARDAAVNPADYSDALGHRRSNMEFLLHAFGDCKIDPKARITRNNVMFGQKSFSLMELAKYEG